MEGDAAANAVSTSGTVSQTPRRCADCCIRPLVPKQQQQVRRVQLGREQKVLLWVKVLAPLGML